MATTRSPWQQYAGYGALGGGLAGILGGLFGGGKPDFQNPADSSMPYLQNLPEALRPYFQPYMQHGEQAYGQMSDINKLLQNQYGSMMNDPNAFLAKIGAGYKQSPGYQWSLNQAMQGGKNAAAAGGALGTPANQQQMEQTAEGMANQDYQQYLQNAFGVLGQGQKGMGGIADQLRSIYGLGAQMSGEYGTDIGQGMMSQAQMAAEAAKARNQYNQDQSNSESQGWGNLAGIGMGLLGFL
jgi:hypothetical protein